ncbi:MAG: peptidoglycan editing factor PgeF [Gammaproteobacteria bacterium]|nr:peptidoglycan editing factor PgeF [Gammaproteobacteria bacterium]
MRAGCSLRGGGRSLAPYASLNLGDHVGDDPAAVRANRVLLRATLRLPEEPLWLRQEHGIHVADADAERGAQSGAECGTEVDLNALAKAGAAAAHADAAVARASRRPLAILVADCMPVLLASADGAVLGAAHAGWRGLSAGVLEATVRAMAVAPAGIHAWLGPAIGARHFEVGDEVRAAFLAHDAHAGAAFTANARGRWQCDLQWLARSRLAALGVRQIAAAGPCTFEDAANCFSYRREARTGRMAALLWREGTAARGAC